MLLEMHWVSSCQLFFLVPRDLEFTLSIPNYYCHFADGIAEQEGFQQCAQGHAWRWMKQ